MLLRLQLDMACTENTAMQNRRLLVWDTDTLDGNGRYEKASDVHEAGRLLKRLADQPWSELAKGLCDELIGKQLTASEALGRLYLTG